jgi:usherin
MHTYKIHFIKLSQCPRLGTESTSQLCDKSTGKCQCKANVEGRSCNLCKSGTFNLTQVNPRGCEACICDPTGTEGGSLTPLGELTCDQTTGQCTCLANRIGRRCNDCNPGIFITTIFYWFITKVSPVNSVI